MTLNEIFALQGEAITHCSISEVIKVSIDNKTCYVKRYYAGGKGLRRWFGRSRVRGEWENLNYFKQLGIPTADVVAFAEERRFGLFKRGALITAEIPNSNEMANLSQQQLPMTKQRSFRRSVIEQVARYTKRLHAAGFIHGDLKWRNILVTLEDKPRVYFIDCPLGRKRFWCFTSTKLNDLRHLARLAKQYCSTWERKLFVYYYQHKCLKGK